MFVFHFNPQIYLISFGNAIGLQQPQDVVVHQQDALAEDGVRDGGRVVGGLVIAHRDARSEHH